jgi:hypothetical protein
VVAEATAGLVSAVGVETATLIYGAAAALGGRCAGRVGAGVPRTQRLRCGLPALPGDADNVRSDDDRRWRIPTVSHRGTGGSSGRAVVNLLNQKVALFFVAVFWIDGDSIAERRRCTS